MALLSSSAFPAELLPTANVIPDNMNSAGGRLGSSADIALNVSSALAASPAVKASIAVLNCCFRGEPSGMPPGTKIDKARSMLPFAFATFAAWLALPCLGSLFLAAILHLSGVFIKAIFDSRGRAFKAITCRRSILRGKPLSIK